MKRAFLLVALLMLSVSAFAQTTSIPPMMNFQGHLAKPDGTPVPDGNYQITFSIFAAATGGTALWTQTMNPVIVHNGTFAVLLGNGSPLTASMLNGTPYLEIKVGSDNPLPRQQFASVAFAFKANTVPDGAITTAKIADSAVTNQKVQSVDWAKITNRPSSLLTLPYTGSVNSASAAFSLSNIGAGTAIYGSGSDGIGLFGVSKNNAAIWAENSSTVPSSAVIVALSRGGANAGVFAQSQSNYGVQGVSDSSIGVLGSSNSGYGLTGISTSNYGIFGQSTSGVGVYGLSTTGAGVWARNTSATPTEAVIIGQGIGNAGVYGQSITNYGVQGVSSSSIAVLGSSQSSYGIYGYSGSNAGVYGTTTSGTAGLFDGPVIVRNYHGANMVGLGDGYVPGTNFGPLDGGRGIVDTYGSAGQPLCSMGYIVQGGQPTDRGAISVSSNGYNQQAAMFVDTDGLGVISAARKFFRLPRPGYPDTEIVYGCIEGPELAVYTRGTAQLVNGKAVITLPSHFLEVASEEGITVSLTPLSADSMGLAVTRKSLKQGIEICELYQGAGNYAFDYEIKAVRRGEEGHQVYQPRLIRLPNGGITTVDQVPFSFLR